MSATTTAHAADERAYVRRVGIVVVLLLLVTVGVVLLAPVPSDVAVVNNTPSGADVATSEAIVVTFSRAVDRRSAEDAFLLYPTTRGRLTWRDAQTLVFTPDPALRPATLYSVTIRTNIRDTRGRSNQQETRWSFRTR